MKTCILFLISCFVALALKGQGCLPEGITFTSQSQIDNFQANYPGCTQIEGSVSIIGDNNGSGITNLDGLDIITAIGGDLSIQYAYVLDDLSGLNGLTSIGGDLAVQYTGLQNFSGLGNLTAIGGSLLLRGINANLTSLTGLEGLASVGGDLVVTNDFYLTSLSGLAQLSSLGGDLIVEFNDALVSLAGLDNLSYIGGGLSIHNNYALTYFDAQGICNYLAAPNGEVDIYSNSTGCNSPAEIAQECGITLPCLPFGNYYFFSQADLDSFQVDYPGCTDIGGNVQIGEQYQNSNISSLTGLNNVTSIDSNLIFYNNNLLASMSGLENLSAIGGNLEIYRNNLLTSLPGLENLSSIGGNLEIIQNNSLTGLSGIDALQFIGGDCNIIGNGALLSLSAMHGLDSIGGNLTLGTYPFDMEPCQGNPLLTSLTGLDSLIKIGGNLGIICSSLTDMTGLGNLESIDGSLIIHGNGSLINLTGLGNLAGIGGNLLIGEVSWTYYMPNPSLSSLEGLEGLTAVGGTVSIQFNDILADLTSLGQLSCIGGDLRIGSSPSLTNLTGLEGLDSIGGGLYLSFNNGLSDIAGLGNLAPGSIDDLTITNNSLLSDCNAQSICDYLASPGGAVNIYANASGCNNPAEVAEGCGISLPCLAYGNYYFSTQADVDSFRVNYPECTDLHGDVVIGEGVSHLDSLYSITSIGGKMDLSGGSGLTSLTGLNNLDSVGGDVIISGAGNLVNLAGLDHLESIGGNLEFGNENPSLTSLTGLESLTSVGGYLYIGTGHALSDLTGLNNLATIGGSLSSPGGLPDYSGLEGLTSIGGMIWIQFEYGLVDFEGLQNLESIGGDFVVNLCNVRSMDGLENLSQIGGRLIIASNGNMASLSGLQSLTTIGGELDIIDNPPLESLSGLDNIEAGSISHLKIWGNTQLSECAVKSICDYLANPNGTIEIYGNHNGCASLGQVQAECLTEVEEIDQHGSTVSIWPNPTTGKFQITNSKFHSSAGGPNSRIEIVNLTGNVVLEGNIGFLTTNGKRRTADLELDISNLPAGIYFIRINIDNEMITSKIIKL